MRLEKLRTTTRNLPTTQDELLSRKQLCTLFGMSLMSVIRLEQAGHLKPLHVGARSIRYRRSDVTSYINSLVAVQQ